MHSSSPQSGKRIRKHNCLVFPPGSGNSQFTSRSIQKRSSPSGQPTKYHSDIMTLYLLGRMSERWLVPGSLGKTHMLKRVRYKLYEDSGNFSFSKFGGSSGQGCARTSPLKKSQIAASCIHKEGNTMPGGPLHSGDNMFHTWARCSGPYAG